MKRGASKGGGKRKAAATDSKVAAKKKKVATLSFDDEVESEEGGGSEEGEEIEVSSEEEEEIKETPDEKRHRLTKEYLATLSGKKLNDDGELSDDSMTNGHDLVDSDSEDDVGDMLTREALEKAGRLHTKVADKFTKMNLNGGHRVMRGHQNSVTSIALSSDDRTAHSASKDGSIIQWDVETGKKVHSYRRCSDSAEGSTEEVLAIAVNTDGNLLASGGRDKFLRVYDVRSNKLLESFKGHKDPISCMAFRRNTNTLYTGSFDRSVKIWNLNEMAYVESLYGHQSNINGVDSYLKEVCTSVGSDRTVRSWQIVQETHLVFRPHNEVRSIDCVKMINEDNFVTGGEDGSISLWSSTKKKPIYTELHAHGASHFISSLTSLYSTDVIASGSGDGKVRIWKADTAGRSISQVAIADVNGFVNGLAFAKSGKFLLAGVGQEHRLGRWWKNQPARNGIHVIPIPLDLTL